MPAHASTSPAAGGSEPPAAGSSSSTFPATTVLPTRLVVRNVPTPLPCRNNPASPTLTGGRRSLPSPPAPSSWRWTGWAPLTAPTPPGPTLSLHRHLVTGHPPRTRTPALRPGSIPCPRWPRQWEVATVLVCAACLPAAPDDPPPLQPPCWQWRASSSLPSGRDNANPFPWLHATRANARAPRCPSTPLLLSPRRWMSAWLRCGPCRLARRLASMAFRHGSYEWLLAPVSPLTPTT